jgi:hypothetical protein
MGGSTVKTRFMLFVGAIFLIVIIIIGAAASSGGRRDTPTGTCTATVNGAVGLSQVSITNQNTGKTIIRTAAELPYTFNLNKGDTIRFSITVLSDYVWNAWEMDREPWFAQDNPLVIKVNGNIVFDANCLVRGG